MHRLRLVRLLLCAVALGLLGSALCAKTVPPTTALPVRTSASASADGLPLTPQMFGAKGDGVEDDTAAVATWMKSGKPLFCAGVFRLTRAVAIDVPRSGGVFLEGAGRQLCKFVLDSPGAGLTIRGGHPDLYRTPEIVIHDASFAPAARLTGPALTIAFTGGSGATDPTIDLRDISVKPAGQEFYAPICLSLENARNGSVEGFNCEGHRGTYAADTKGIVVMGDSQPVEVTLRDVDIYYMETAIALQGTWQGVSINEAVCVACRIGVDATAADASGTWLRVNDSHFNVEDAGVRTVNITNVNIFGNLIYLHDLGFSRAPIRACFDLSMTTLGTQWAKIDGNTCNGLQAKTSPKVGVLLDSARAPSDFLMETRIDGNAFVKLDWGIYLKNTAAVALGGNSFAAIDKADVRNGSDGTGMFQNTQPPSPVPIPSGDQ